MHELPNREEITGRPQLALENWAYPLFREGDETPTVLFGLLNLSKQPKMVFALLNVENLFTPNNSGLGWKFGGGIVRMSGGWMVSPIITNNTPNE